MEILLIIIAIIVAILLILVVLIQPGKADMISGMGGMGGQMTNLLGVRQSRNVLQNATMIFLGTIVVISVVVNKFFVAPGEGNVRTPVSQGVEIPVAPTGLPTQAPPPQQAPAPSATPVQQSK